MKTNIVEVSGMLSALSARGVEEQLTRLRGVKKVEVNYVAGSATVTYDEAQTDLKTIKAKVHECGYHCGGEMVPRHVCAPEDPPAEAAAITPGHMGHVAGVERVDSESPDPLTESWARGLVGHQEVAEKGTTDDPSSKHRTKFLFVDPGEESTEADHEWSWEQGDLSEHKTDGEETT